MMLARLRGGQNPQLAVASTPEGFRWMYRTFVEAEDQSDRHLVRARTLDNPHLPQASSTPLPQLPPQLLAAYLEGQFTNLNSTTVYPYFDRDLHWTDTEIQPDDRIWIGIDFNVGCCFMEVCVRRGDEFHFIDEYHPKDTPQSSPKSKTSTPTTSLAVTSSSSPTPPPANAPLPTPKRATSHCCAKAASL